ncbi:MAG TPA: FKBP-type peptidyl-prolyl cis-trans isomerase [Bacteroidota bacterium]|jgi:FKBP-type peptidyl-prolyl cis-trans isomerase FklB
MKIAFIPVMALVLMACQGNTQEKVQIKTQKDSVSYGIGMNIANNFKRQSVDIDPLVFTQAVKDVMSGGKTLMTEDQATDALAGLQQRMMASQAERMKTLGDKNKKDGEAFLAENKKKPGVVTTASGLQYKIMKAGTGPKPTLSQTVTVNYKGTLIDGTEFDSSYKRGQAVTRAVSGWIQGWVEALQLMPVGSKWQLFVPPSLAYADQPAGPLIGPNSTLVFELELISVK